MSNMKQAIRIINDGGVIAYPTESFFALGADATNARAIRKVFRLKGRGRKPIALIAGSIAQVERYFVVSVMERRLMKRYWPGAMTIVMKPRKAIAADALLGTTTPDPSLKRRGLMGGENWRGLEVSDGRGRKGGGRRGGNGIGVRVPRHALARKLALVFGKPITATSANISGKHPTKLHTVVGSTFHDMVIMNGACGKAKQSSTVLSMYHGKINILRHGAVGVN
jgi:L-threonylcarbamoyladenylate synthase